MNDQSVQSAENYYKKAEKMLEKKELIGFMEKISIAEFLAKETTEMLEKVLFLKVKGLYCFGEKKEVLKEIEKAQNNSTEEYTFKLNCYKGDILGFFGDVEEAKKIHKFNIKNADCRQVKVQSYLSLIWLNLTVEKEVITQEKLKKVKEYLEILTGRLEELPANLKRKVYNNYSLYYYYSEDYEKSLEMLEKAKEFSEERYLPNIYLNMAEVNLKFSEDQISIIDDLLKEAELIATKYEDYIQLGMIFYIQAQLLLRENQTFKALDTLTLSFFHYADAEAFTYAYEVLMKLYELMAKEQMNNLEMMKEKFAKRLEGTTYYNKSLREVK